MIGWHGTVLFLALACVSWRFGRAILESKIAGRMNTVSFVARSHDELFRKFPIRESGQPQNASRVGCCVVAAELTGKVAE